MNTYDAALVVTQPERAFQKLLYTLDLQNGQPIDLPGGRSNPVVISGSAPGSGYLDAGQGVRGRIEGNDIVVDGQIGGTSLAIKDGVQQRSMQRVEFNPMQQLQRPGLLLLNGILYIAFGSIGDFQPYHGWVFAYDADTLEQKGVLCTTPNGAEAGVWQAGEGLVADAAARVYLGTGNGDFQ